MDDGGGQRSVVSTREISRLRPVSRNLALHVPRISDPCSGEMRVNGLMASARSDDDYCMVCRRGHPALEIPPQRGPGLVLAELVRQMSLVTSDQIPDTPPTWSRPGTLTSVDHGHIPIITRSHPPIDRNERRSIVLSACQRIPSARRRRRSCPSALRNSNHRWIRVSLCPGGATPSALWIPVWVSMEI